MANLEFPGKTGGPQQIIAAAQNFTANWVDLGTEYHVAGAANIGLWLELDVNDSTNMRVRMLALHASGGSEYLLPIRTVAADAVNVQDEYVEFTDDVDQLVLLSWSLDGVVPYVQFQIQAGAVGVTAGQVDDAYITTGVYT